MKLYQIQFDNHLEKTYYVVERDPEKALIRAFARVLNDGLSGLAISQIGAGEVTELCDAKDLLLDILDALDAAEAPDDDEIKPQNPDKVLDADGQ